MLALIIKMSRRGLLLIDARNDHVKQGLQSAYASKVPGGKLEVLCASNTIYEKFSRKANSDLVRSMVTGSGIPHIRRSCHSIAADARLLEAKHFLQSSLSSLLNSIDVWVNGALVPAGGDDIDHSIKFDREEIEAVQRKVPPPVSSLSPPLRLPSVLHYFISLLTYIFD